MSDLAILNLMFKDRDVFERYSSSIPSHLLAPEAAILMADLGEWYGLHKSKAVDLKRFWEWFKLVQHPSYNIDKLKTYHVMLEGIRSFPEHDVTAKEILKTLVLREAAAKISKLAGDYADGEGRDFFDQLPELWEAAASEAEIFSDGELEYRGSVKDIIENLTNAETGLSWRTKVFDAAAGPVRGGNFICLAAYVDSGKTSLLASEVTYMASQLPKGKKCLWFNNEQAGGEVKLRILQATTGLSTPEILNVGYEAAEAKYNEILGEEDKIILVDSASISASIVRRKMRQYDVGLVVFDQLHKLQGKLNEYGQNKTDRLSAVFQFGRELAKSHNVPVITSHQARGASAMEQDQNRKQGKDDNFLEMYQLANSREAIQAEVDLLVTMGRNPTDEAHPNRRYFYFAKNKMPTPGNENHRHMRIALEFDTLRGRFK